METSNEQYDQMQPLQPKICDVSSAGILAVSVVLLYIVVSMFMPIYALPITFIVLNALFIHGIAIFLPTAFFIKQRKYYGPHNVKKLPHNLIASCIALGIGLFILATALNGLLVGLYEKLGIYPQDSILSNLSGTDNTLIFLTYVLCICTVPAISEELLCRGALLYTFRRMGMVKSALISGLFFALMHSSFISLPIYIFLGFIFGVVAYKARCIFASSIVHFVYNLCGLCVMGLINSAPEQTIETANDASITFIVYALTIAVGILITFFAMRRFLRNTHANDKKEAYSKGIDIDELLLSYNGDTNCKHKGFVLFSVVCAVLFLLCTTELFT